MLRDNAFVIGVVASIVLGVVGLWYKIKHDRDERCRKDKESKESTRSALKRMYEELKDTLDAIEADKGIHNYRDREGVQPILFLKTKFWHTDCENLIKSPEMRDIDLDVNKIKDVIGIIKENNRIFDWMERDLPPTKNDGGAPLVEDSKFPNMLEECKKMHGYQERLRKDIPLILQKIREACDQLS